MWKTRNSFYNKILKYLLIFSMVLLFILWFFMFWFFPSFFKKQKVNEITRVSNYIKYNKSDEDFEELLNYVSLKAGVCIEVLNSNYNTVYSSTRFGKGCFSSNESTYQFKFDFISKNIPERSYELVDNDLGSTILVNALKLDDDFIFINSNIEPINSTLKLLRRELNVITLITFIFSVILASFTSIRLSKPIIDINNNAKKLPNKQADDFKKTSILEVNELVDTLNYVRDELNKMDEYRRDLMANVSHDLKTPLTLIKAKAEIVKDLHISDKEKITNDMNTVIDEVDYLTVLVNDILVLSKMESVPEELNYEKFDLIELINHILLRYNVLEETENYQFIFNHNRKKVMINADSLKLEQAIYNLINNAINYTGDDHKVYINVTCKDKILVEITDTGKGIKEEELPYIWDKYYKNNKKHKRNLIGTGLGLSIVRSIFEEHKFKYGVKSKINEGSTFYFEIEKEEK